MQNILGERDTVKLGLKGYKETIDYNWHGKMITIRTFLDIDTEVNTIRSIVNCCYDIKHCCFMPEFIDMAIRINIIKSYAYVELPDDVEIAHKILYVSDLYDVVLKCANQCQIDSIISSAKMMIKTGEEYGE